MVDSSDTHHDDADPAQAFDDLRSEVSVLRRAVEALPGAWQAHQAPDYSPDLGSITQGLAVVVGQLDLIHAHPALATTPAQYGQAIAQAGNSVMREAVQKLDRATQAAERERQQLAGLIGTARRQDEQRNWLIYVGIAAFLIGVMVSPFIASVLPFGLDSRIAALIMYRDRWEAGEALMQAGDPDAWRRAVNVMSVSQGNQKEIDQCSAAAAKSGKAQRCAITVPIPEQ